MFRSGTSVFMEAQNLVKSCVQCLKTIVDPEQVEMQTFLRAREEEHLFFGGDQGLSLLHPHSLPCVDRDLAQQKMESILY